MRLICGEAAAGPGQGRGAVDDRRDACRAGRRRGAKGGTEREGCGYAWAE